MSSKEQKKIKALNHYYSKDDEDYYYNMHKYLKECIDLKDKEKQLTAEERINLYLSWFEIYKQVRDSWDEADD